MGMIRVALALAVLFTHLPITPFKVMGGGTAVQCFFIVSGFYMALVLDGKYTSRSLFYSNRLLRLLPSYYVVMLLSAAALFGLGLSATATPELFAQAFAQPGTALLLGLQNLGLLGQELLFWFRLDATGLVFDPSGALPSETVTVAWQALLVPQAWSLSIELMFYALAPFLARLRTSQLVLLAAASIALRLAGFFLPVDYGIWQGRFFPAELFLFLLGMLGHRALPWAAAAAPALRYGALVLALALIAGLPQLGLPPEATRWLAYAGLALATPLAFSALRHSAADRWLGELSYPIYLGHLLVVAAVLTYEPPQAFWVALLGTVGFALLLLLLVERPVDRWRQARVQALGG